MSVKIREMERRVKSQREYVGFATQRETLP